MSARTGTHFFQQIKKEVFRGIKDVPVGFRAFVEEGVVAAHPPRPSGRVETIKSPLDRYAREFAKKYPNVGYLEHDEPDDGESFKPIDESDLSIKAQRRRERDEKKYYSSISDDDTLTEEEFEKQLSQDAYSYARIKLSAMQKGLDLDQATHQATREIFNKLEQRSIELNMIRDQAIQIGIPSYNPSSHLKQLEELHEVISDRALEFESISKRDALEETLMYKKFYGDDSPIQFDLISQFSPLEIHKFISEYPEYKEYFYKPYDLEQQQKENQDLVDDAEIDENSDSLEGIDTGEITTKKDDDQEIDVSAVNINEAEALDEEDLEAERQLFNEEGGQLSEQDEKDIAKFAEFNDILTGKKDTTDDGSVPIDKEIEEINNTQLEMDLNRLGLFKGAQDFKGVSKDHLDELKAKYIGIQNYIARVDKIHEGKGLDVNSRSPVVETKIHLKIITDAAVSMELLIDFLKMRSPQYLNRVNQEIGHNVLKHLIQSFRRLKQYAFVLKTDLTAYRVLGYQYHDSLVPDPKDMVDIQKAYSYMDTKAREELHLADGSVRDDIFNAIQSIEDDIAFDSPPQPFLEDNGSLDESNIRKLKDNLNDLEADMTAYNNIDLEADDDQENDVAAVKGEGQQQQQEGENMELQQEQSGEEGELNEQQQENGDEEVQDMVEPLRDELDTQSIEDEEVDDIGDEGKYTLDGYLIEDYNLDIGREARKLMSEEEEKLFLESYKKNKRNAAKGFKNTDQVDIFGADTIDPLAFHYVSKSKDLYGTTLFDDMISQSQGLTEKGAKLPTADQVDKEKLITNIFQQHKAPFNHISIDGDGKLVKVGDVSEDVIFSNQNYLGSNLWSTDNVEYPITFSETTMKYLEEKKEISPELSRFLNADADSVSQLTSALESGSALSNTARSSLRRHFNPMDWASVETVQNLKRFQDGVPDLNQKSVVDSEKFNDAYNATMKSTFNDIFVNDKDKQVTFMSVISARKQQQQDAMLNKYNTIQSQLEKVNQQIRKISSTFYNQDVKNLIKEKDQLLAGRELEDLVTMEQSEFEVLTARLSDIDAKLKQTIAISALQDKRATQKSKAYRKQKRFAIRTIDQLLVQQTRLEKKLNLLENTSEFFDYLKENGLDTTNNDKLGVMFEEYNTLKSHKERQETIKNNELPLSSQFVNKFWHELNPQEKKKILLQYKKQQQQQNISNASSSTVVEPLSSSSVEALALFSTNNNNNNNSNIDEEQPKQQQKQQTPIQKGEIRGDLSLDDVEYGSLKDPKSVFN